MTLSRSNTTIDASRTTWGARIGTQTGSPSTLRRRTTAGHRPNITVMPSAGDPAASADADRDPLDLFLENNGAGNDAYEEETEENVHEGMRCFYWFHSLHLALRLVLAILAGTLLFVAPAAILITINHALAPDLGEGNPDKLAENGQLSWLAQLVRWSIWAAASCNAWTVLWYFISAVPMIVERSVYFHGDLSERMRSLLEYFPALRFWIVQMLWMSLNVVTFAVVFAQYKIVPLWRSVFLGLCVALVFSVCLFFQRLSVQAIAFNFHIASHEGRIAQYKLAIRTLERLRKALKAAAKRDAVDRAYARAANALASSSTASDGSVHASANGNTIGSIRKLFDMSSQPVYSIFTPSKDQVKSASENSAASPSGSASVPALNSLDAPISSSTSAESTSPRSVSSNMASIPAKKPAMRPLSNTSASQPVEMQILISHDEPPALQTASAPISLSHLGLTMRDSETVQVDQSLRDSNSPLEYSALSDSRIDFLPQFQPPSTAITSSASSSGRPPSPNRSSDLSIQRNEQQVRFRSQPFVLRATGESSTPHRTDTPYNAPSSTNDSASALSTPKSERRWSLNPSADPAAAAELLSNNRKMEHHRMIASSIMIGGYKYIKRVQSLERVSYKNAVRLAHKLFVALGGSSEHEIDLDAFKPYFPDETSAREAFGLFDLDGNGTLTDYEFKRAVLHVYQERHNLFCSLRDLSQALGRLNQALYILSILVTAFISLPIYGISLDVLVPLASILLALGVAFGSSAKTTIDCIVFLFVSHPYDSGDRVVIDGQNMRVVELHLLSTVFERMDGQRVYIQNAVLSQKQINNIRRSGDQIELLELWLDFNTPEERIHKLQARMLEFVKSRPRDFLPQCELVITSLEPIVNKIRCQMWLRYKGNWQDSAKRFSRRNAFFYALKKNLEDLKIMCDITPALSVAAGLASEISGSVLQKIGS